MDSPARASDGRPLSAMEQLFWSWDQHRPNHFVLAAEIEFRYSPEQWRQALDSLQVRHPLLGARIVEVASGGVTCPVSLDQCLLGDGCQVMFVMSSPDGLRGQLTQARTRLELVQTPGR